MAVCIITPGVKRPSDPNPGIHPLALGWFHITPIHTVVDERLGLSENKAMKLLTSTFVSLLLIGFA